MPSNHIFPLVLDADSMGLQKSPCCQVTFMLPTSESQAGYNHSLTEQQRPLLLYRPRDRNSGRGEDLCRSRHKVESKPQRNFQAGFLGDNKVGPGKSAVLCHTSSNASVQVQLHLPGDSPQTPHTKTSVRMKNIYSHSGEINIHGTNVRNDWLEIRRPLMKSEFRLEVDLQKNPGSRLFQSRGLMWMVMSTQYLTL